MTTVRPAPAEVDRRQPSKFRAAADPSGRIALTGELDITQLDALRAILDEALQGSQALLPLDAGELSFIDSAAVSELLRYQLVLAARQRRLWLEPVSDSVETTLGLFDLQHILGPETAAT